MAEPGRCAMPIAIKDNIVTVEQPTTCASRILEGIVRRSTRRWSSACAAAAP